MTILFTDIRSFTSISEAMNAEELTHFINAFLTPMTDVLLRHRATIDKYMGDSIMAFWNAPLDNPRHPRDACKAALDMVFELSLLNKEKKFETAFSEQISIGIGLNTGECSVGNMGSEQRFDYSVIGDSVNLASRLEGLCKTYGVSIVTGANTAAAVPDFAVVEIDRVKVKGKNAAETIYALLGDEVLAQKTEFQAFKTDFSEMLSHYRDRDWEKAREALNRAQAVPMPDLALEVKGLCELFADRIQTLRSTPLPGNWDGVFTAKEK